MISPNDAAENFAALNDLGARGAFGFYEAVDFTKTRVAPSKRYEIVKAYMAHHQGMTIVALANAVLGDLMPKRFHAEPIVQATELLLQERAPRLLPKTGSRATLIKPRHEEDELRVGAMRRTQDAHGTSPDCHILSNGRYSTLVTAAGSGYSRWNGLAITRWRADPTTDDLGLISLLGGKWTTYRVMAQDTIDHAAELLRGSKGGCKTADHKLVGAQNFDKNGYQALQKTYNLPEDVARHLNQKYGSRASKVADLIKKDADLSEKLTPQYPHIKVEVVYCATEEMACSVRDFVARRTRLELMDWEAALAVTPEVARLMGSVLGWTEAKTASETTHYSTLIRQFKALNP